jgi:3',5'-cyclic AMP phosphodiesterase CpdA
MKNLKVFCLLLMIFIGASCAKDQLFNSPDQFPDKLNSANVISPKIKIAVVSDIHYLDPTLMPDDISNPYFQTKMSFDRKLIELSDPILRKVISELITEKPDILLITGDLSCEGELVSHETVKGFLQQLEDEGIKIYVVPGNNDINNPVAVTYKTLPPTQVPNINSDDFASLYGNFGYNEALYRDEENSLSYICQPCSGLWILGIEANEFTETGVTINPATMVWIQEKMAEANNNNITVLAMLHYGIIEHYSGQNTPEPLIENSEVIATALLNAGIRLIFTGHYHANDIVEFTNNGKTLTDIQTGSLVTPLSPYRIMTLDDNFIKIETKRISDVDTELPEGMDFLTYSDVTITNRLNNLFYYFLRGKIFKINNKADAKILAPFVTNAYKAYLAGDEKLSPAERNNINSINTLTSIPYPLVVDLLNSLWTDLPPKDNKAHIKLK